MLQSSVVQVKHLDILHSLHSEWWRTLIRVTLLNGKLVHLFIWCTLRELNFCVLGCMFKNTGSTCVKQFSFITMNWKMNFEMRNIFEVVLEHLRMYQKCKKVDVTVYARGLRMTGSYVISILTNRTRKLSWNVVFWVLFCRFCSWFTGVSHGELVNQVLYVLYFSGVHSRIITNNYLSLYGQKVCTV